MTTMSSEDEVNEFLERAIDARNVEHLKEENVRPVILKFRKQEYENKVESFLPDNSMPILSVQH